MGSWFGLIAVSKRSALTWLLEHRLNIRWQIFLLLCSVHLINPAFHIQSPLGKINSTCSLSPTTDDEKANSSCRMCAAEQSMCSQEEAHCTNGNMKVLGSSAILETASVIFSYLRTNLSF